MPTELQAGRRDDRGKTMGMDVTKEQVRRYLCDAVSEQLDDHGGEVNCTQLAEYAANAFDKDHWLDDETHWIWEVAAAIAEDCELASRCPECDGQLNALGTLGKIVHYRCRHCGLDFAGG